MIKDNPLAVGILFAYIAVSGFVLRLILVQHPPVFIVWFFFIVWILLGIIIFGVTLAVYENKSIVEGLQQGVQLLKAWAAYIVGMIAIAGLLYFMAQGLS